MTIETPTLAEDARATDQTEFLEPVTQPDPAAADELVDIELALRAIRQEIHAKVSAHSFDGPGIIATLASDIIQPHLARLYAVCETSKHAAAAADSTLRMLNEELEQLHGLVVRYEAGRDDTPVPSGTSMTDAQAWNFLLQLDADERLALMREWRETSDIASACRVHNHAGRIAIQDEQIGRMRAELAELHRRPTHHAFEAVAAIGERQRVTLVSKLDLDPTTTFDSAMVAVDGMQRALWAKYSQQVTVEQFHELTEAKALREIKLCLGPNALTQLEENGFTRLSGGERSAIVGAVLGKLGINVVDGEPIEVPE